MRLDVHAVFFEGTIMGDFMYIGDEELVGVEIVVDGDLLYLPVPSVPKIPQLAATSSRDGEMKRVFLPQVPTVL